MARAAPLGAPTGVSAPLRPRRSLDPSRSWPWIDRVGFYASCMAGFALCAVTAAIVLFMFYKGISQLHLDLLTTSPTGDPNQSQAGGFLDPIEGTLILTAVGTVIATPIAIGVAAWLTEYSRPPWLARAVDSGIEMISGAPSVVLAIFGLLVFSQGSLAFLSQTASGGQVLGRSFFAAGAMMSLLALPLIFASTREALLQVPGHVREASYALGKTKSTTIRRVLLPGVRSSIASGIALGMGRIIGDTAIVILLLGGSLGLSGAGGAPVLSTLRGTGSTLTSYVYNNSPAGEGNAPEKAYAAAFVLLLLVLALNGLVSRLTSGRGGASWTR